MNPARRSARRPAAGTARRSPPGDGGAATITDVARRASVSVATVSRVMNANYPVAEDTRVRVLQAARDLGYVANAHARALIKSTTGTVGIIVHDVSDPYFAEIVKGIQGLAEAHGRLIVLCNSLRDPEREVTYIELLRGQRVDAVILIGGYVEDDAFLLALGEQARGLRAQGSRLVLCGYHPIRADAVVPDNTSGAYQITFELLRAGHRRIAHIGGLADFSTTDERHKGYLGALASFGVPPDPALELNADFSRDGGYDACGRLLRHWTRAAFTAIFAANDLMAIGALAALREAGLRVPEDISVVGFDDIPISRDLLPALSTVAVPMIEMGRRSMELALAPAGSAEQVVRLPTRVVMRGSTGPVPAGPAGAR